MISTTIILLAALATAPALAAPPTPTSTSTPATVSPVFCTDATYSPDDPYPYGTPMGAGYCFVPGVVEGKCYKWASFPHSQSGPLNHNLTFAHIGNAFRCNLYKNKHCGGDSYPALPGDEDFGNAETADTSYDDAVESFVCVAS